MAQLWRATAALPENECSSPNAHPQLLVTPVSGDPAPSYGFHMHLAHRHSCIDGMLLGAGSVLFFLNKDVLIISVLGRQSQTVQSSLIDQLQANEKVGAFPKNITRAYPVIAWSPYAIYTDSHMVTNMQAHTQLVLKQQCGGQKPGQPQTQKLICLCLRVLGLKVCTTTPSYTISF